MIKQIGAFAGLASFIGLALLALLSFTQGRDIRRLREWAGSAPERDSERKEQTSAVAAQRAEELRRLEEAREGEREAAALREQRRERREAGLPELTRRERLRQRFDGSRLGEPRYLVAIFIVAVLVGGGVAYAVLHAGGDSAGHKQSAKVPAGDIRVAVLNSTAVAGLAADVGDRVESKGFEVGTVSNTSSTYEISAVMFKPGSAPEAHRVAKALKISKVQPMSQEVASVSGGSPVAVIVGEDNASSAG
ncbi:MAG TPA: LytR C-terminal domain-containing protein [Solirubrobacterales bacterium]|nr:LytR C-terminal domain-containing protein [Solirubrobacterales bacterium]